MAIWKLFSGKKKTPQEMMAGGDLEGARRGFYEVLKESGFDPIIQVQVADLNVKLGQRVEAKKLYVEVGQYYAERGFFNKSVAIFKKALTINPEDTKILAQLASYNDMVPKFMINERFLNKFRGNDEQPPEAGKPAEEETEAEATTTTVAVPLASEDGITGLADEQDMGYDPDFKAVQDLSTDISAEFERDQLRPPDLSARGGVEDDSFDDLLSIHMEEEVYEPATTTDPPFLEKPKQPEEQPASGPARQSATKPLHHGKTVFSTRNGETTSDKSSKPTAFTSFDDALDTIFDSGASTPAARAEKAAHQKHWALFRTMPREIFMDFVKALECREYEAQARIVGQGESGEEMYLIAEGGVEVQMARGERKKRMAQLGEGDFFGEAALLTGELRNASVIALRPTHCLVLSRTDLQNLTESHPSIMASIESIYYTRQKHNASRWQ